MTSAPPGFAPSGSTPPRFRPNVCAVVWDSARGRVMVFHRVDLALGEDCWQFPQGGIHPGETPREALVRELREEIGTDRVTILRQAPHPIRYLFSPDILERLIETHPEKAGYQGQEQIWFLVSLQAGEEDIHFRHQPPEFDAYRWVSPSEALDGATRFKTGAYREGLGALGLLEDPPSIPPLEGG
ncbi:MAG: NUDIX domain-containing protein [Deltaproteobacteria bacterium]|nr:NUDIX domain-containing protein [Deltaproteobacteria bacterium]